MALKVLLEECNVSRAATRLSLTQPTVSGMLARLRDLFGDPLFVRTQHGMLPTPRAESLAPDLERVLEDVSRLVLPRKFEPSTVEMDVRISANDYMQSTILVPFLQSLRRDAPRVRVAVRNLVVRRLEQMLASREIDVAITIPEFVDSKLQTRFLYREEYICVVREVHPVRSATISMERYLSHDHVMVSPTDGIFSGPADEALSRMGLKRRVALSVPSFLVLLEVLQTDDLIALVPKRLLTGRTDGLRLIKPPMEVSGFDTVLAWHQCTHHDPARSWLRDQLVITAANL